jgi:hypothetical protein
MKIDGITIDLRDLDASRVRPHNERTRAGRAASAFGSRPESDEIYKVGKLLKRMVGGKI